MSFLDALAPFLDTATEGVNAYAQGGRDRQAQAQADALADLERRQKEAEAKRRAAMDALSAQNTLSLIRDRERPAPSAPRNIDPLSPEGRTATLELERERAKLRPPGGGGNIDPLSSEGIAAASRRQAELARTAPPRTTLPSEAERKANGLYLTGKQGYDTLEAILAKGKDTPGLLNRAASRIGMGVGNVMSSDELRQRDQAAYDLSEAWLRLTSGAAISAQEITNAAKALIPQPGDDPATLAQKANSRRTRIEALRQAAGRALNPHAQGTASPQDDLDARIDAVLGGRAP